MKIAVTGASGHIGSNLCPLLVEEGHDLKVLVYKSKKGIPRKNVEVVNGSITNLADVETLIDGVDAVIHLAAKISIEEDTTGIIEETNLLGTKNVVSACVKHKVKRLIHFSSIHTFNPFPLNEVLDETRGLVDIDATDYDKSKIAGDLLIEQVRNQGVETIILCPTSVFGPNDYKPSLLGSAIIDIASGKFPALAPGGYDFVDVRDIAKATISALEKGVSGEKYILSGNYLSIKDLAFKIGEIAGVRTAQIVLPMWILKMLLPLFKLYSSVTKKPSVFTKESLEILMSANPNISSRKATADLGYTKTSFDISMKDTLDWFKN